MQRRKSQRVMVALSALGVLGVVACAQERAPINRVQPEAMSKTFFLGEDIVSPDDDPEFYMRGTVIDVGYGASQDGLFTSTYAQPVSRVRWEVTEDYLNARLAYERIEGTDSSGKEMEGLTRTESNSGQIVASYRIKSHFDIMHDYNPVTGEELNVISENTSDRPWNERSYVRVDWSQNHAVHAYDFDTLAMIGIYGGVEYESLAFSVLDPNDPNAPQFDIENGYFDVTNKVFAKPQLIDLSSLGWGIDSFPACMLPGEFAGGTSPTGNCNPVEVTLRHSFKRVVDKDYEPLHYDGMRFQAYGIFNFQYRYGYERNYGLLDNKWFRFASRYNIWKRSHYYDNPEEMTGWISCATKETTAPTGDTNADPNRDENGDGTADECEEVTARVGKPGSQCDIFKARCTLPYTTREQVVIPWYVNGQDDEDIFEATNWAAMEWDIAMRTAVQTSRLVECRAGYGGEACDIDYPMWNGQQDDIDDAVTVRRELDFCYRKNGYDSATCKTLVDTLIDELGAERGDPDAISLAAMRDIFKQEPAIVLCHNPVAEKDHAACGERGLSARLGDLRYNNVLIIDRPQTPSAWGIMVDADDPVTGEKIATSVNVWDYVNDLAAQGVVDLVRYINGEMTTEQLTNGEYIRDWARATELAQAGSGSIMKKAQIQERLAAGTKLTAKQFSEHVHHGLSHDMKQQLAPIRNKALDAAIRSGTPSANQAMVAARMREARGTAVEAQLINQAMLQHAGIPGDMPIDGPMADIASPFGLNNPKMASQLRRMKQNALAERGACILYEAPEPTAMTGLAHILSQKFPALAGETMSDSHKRYEAMHRYVRRKMHYAVIAHEMGHSVGHRHNFVSSSDALFYRPQYWQLRTKNGNVNTICTDGVDDGNTCVGPRYYDPVTDEESEQMIWMFSQSSVMDYPGDVTQDFIGLGVWDFAATRMFYGDNVSVYTNDDYKAGTRVGVGLTNATDTFGGLVGIKFGVGSFSGLTDIHYSALQKEYGVIDDCYNVTPKEPTWWNSEKDGAWDPLLDGHIVKIDGQYTKCRQQPVDYVGWRQLRMPTLSEIGGGYYRGGPSIDANNRTRVPYGFATDNWADLGNVSVYRHDSGADPYEIAQFLIHSQENRHILDNFRRGRTGFNVRSAAGRAFGRYNEKLLGIASGLGFYSNIYKNYSTGQGLTFDSLWPYIVNESVRENMLAATVVFDHFVRQLARPQSGEHYKLNSAFGDMTLRSADDADGNAGSTLVVIPNGSSGYLQDVGFGGAPLHNALSETNGDYDTDYTMNAGSYYPKINTAILMAESEDRFISQSRGDFYDARFRAAGIADVVPEGYRRVIANTLTNDRGIMAPRLAANASGVPLLDVNADPEMDPFARQYPAQPMGWVSWWPNEGPSTCFASNGRNVCENYSGDTAEFDPDMPANMVAVDPQIGWEVQKFMIAWTLAYIPSNQRANWIDMMRLYRMGIDSSPEFENRIEWQDPESGEIYYARRYGRECLFGTGANCDGGKIVEKGIAARVLEYANDLTANGYKLDVAAYPGGGEWAPGFNDYGRAMVVRHPDTTPVVVPDPALVDMNTAGGRGETPEACDTNIDATCTPLSMMDNHFAYELSGYKSVPDYLWQVMVEYKLASPEQLGLYGD